MFSRRQKRFLFCAYACIYMYVCVHSYTCNLSVDIRVFELSKYSKEHCLETGFKTVV